MQNIYYNYSISWNLIVDILSLIFSIPTAVYILLHKNDGRAAISWIGLVFFVPLFGCALYWMFGINRVKARAKVAKGEKHKTDLCSKNNPENDINFHEKWLLLMRAGRAIHDRPYLSGNHAKPLIDGDETYPRMLASISEAKHDIILSSYIFDNDKTGRKFIEALGAARKRNVAIYVLLDGVFLGYSWRRTERELQKAGVTTARFFPLVPRFINLRNHRKILCIDGKIAFIGGMNIRQDNMIRENPCNPVHDIHFEVKGPVINQISEVFADDWCFSTGKILQLSQASIEGKGLSTCRVLPDGPDENYQKLEWTILAAISCANHSIRIMTPYFIIDRSIAQALQIASLRGIEVEVMVPGKNNIPFFNWAMQADFKDLLKFGVKIYESEPPFEHSKFMLVDDYWSFIGSANWDTRSLALNFEINLEAYDVTLNNRLAEIFSEKRKKASVVSKHACDNRSLYIQIRNNLFRLLAPYL